MHPKYLTHNMIIYDAINLFKYSPAGQGTYPFPYVRADEAEVRQKCKSLAADVGTKLWALWNANDIGFITLPKDLAGEAGVSKLEFDICVNVLAEPEEIISEYPNYINQTLLAATSCIIVHEAGHLAAPSACHAEQETLSRVLSSAQFQYLSSAPRHYKSEFTGRRCIAQYLPRTVFYDSFQDDLDAVSSQTLIDNVLDIWLYRVDLESDPTAEFIVRSLRWWGGLSNRRPSTRGYYLRSLASRKGDYFEPILRILESLTARDWAVARTCCGDVERIRKHIRRGPAASSSVDDKKLATRLQRVQQTLGESLGIQSRWP